MVTIEFTKPNPPNFINCHRGDTPITIPIQELTAEEIREYAELFRLTIIQHWEKKNERAPTQ
jgi:hypothetical protein